MVHRPPESLLQMIDSADTAGLATIRPLDTTPIPNVDVARERLLSELYSLHFTKFRLGRAKSASTEIGLTQMNTPAGPELTFSVAKLFMLPGLAPAEELAEFRRFIVEVQRHYEAHPGRMVYLTIGTPTFVGQDLRACLKFRLSTTASTSVEDEEVSRVLYEMVSESPTLTGWLERFIQEMQHAGNLPQISLWEDELFGRWKGPCLRHRLNEHLKEDIPV